MLESEEYLQQRIEWAGGQMPEIFAAEAARMICQASDGNPRCLNQLADHSLLVAEAAGKARIETGHVLEALEELKQLPLQWNHVAIPRASETHSQPVEIIRETSDTPETSEGEPQTACFEWVAPEEEILVGEITEEEILVEESTEELLAEVAETEHEEDEIEIAWDAEELVILPDLEGMLAQELAIETPIPPVESPSALIEFEEEFVTDHYAQLDRGMALPLCESSPRDWHTWDPLEELRIEEDAFALPPVSSAVADVTVIHAMPLPGEEWQPEDLCPASRKPIPGDPTEIIDRILPWIDAALDNDLLESEPIPSSPDDFSSEISQNRPTCRIGKARRL